MIFFGGEIAEVVKQSEQEASISWETLTKENAMETVSRATELLNADAVTYVRTTKQGVIEWRHKYMISPSSCPSSRVQFHSNPKVARHWVAVELPIKGEKKPKNIEIRTGQRFFIPQDERFLVVEGADWYSDISGPAKGEKPMTKYEFYIPTGKR